MLQNIGAVCPLVHHGHTLVYGKYMLTEYNKTMMDESALCVNCIPKRPLHNGEIYPPLQGQHDSPPASLFF